MEKTYRKIRSEILFGKPVDMADGDIKQTN